MNPTHPASPRAAALDQPTLRDTLEAAVLAYDATMAPPAERAAAWSRLEPSLLAVLERHLDERPFQPPRKLPKSRGALSVLVGETVLGVTTAAGMAGIDWARALALALVALANERQCSLAEAAEHVAHLLKEK